MNLTKKLTGLKNFLQKNKIYFFIGVCVIALGIILYAFSIFSKNVDQAADASSHGTYTNAVWSFYPWMMGGTITLGIGVILLLITTDDNSTNGTPPGQVGERVQDGGADIGLPDKRVRKNSNRVRTKPDCIRDGSGGRSNLGNRRTPPRN